MNIPKNNIAGFKNSYNNYAIYVKGRLKPGRSCQS